MRFERQLRNQTPADYRVKEGLRPALDQRNHMAFSDDCASELRTVQLFSEGALSSSSVIGLVVETQREQQVSVDFGRCEMNLKISAVWGKASLRQPVVHVENYTLGRCDLTSLISASGNTFNSLESVLGVPNGRTSRVCF